MTKRIVTGAHIDLLEIGPVTKKTRAGKLRSCQCDCGATFERTESQLKRDLRAGLLLACHDCVLRIKREETIARLMTRWGGKRIGQVTPVAVVSASAEHPRFRCDCSCGGHVDVREDKLERAELHGIDIGCRACRDRFGRPLAAEAAE
jgi:hypothetical protein